MLMLTEQFIPLMHRNGLSSCLCGCAQSWHCWPEPEAVSTETQSCCGHTALSALSLNSGLGRCSQLAEQQVYPNSASLGKEFPQETVTVHWQWVLM